MDAQSTLNDAFTYAELATHANVVSHEIEFAAWIEQVRTAGDEYVYHSNSNWTCEAF